LVLSKAIRGKGGKAQRKTRESNGFSKKEVGWSPLPRGKRKKIKIQTPLPQIHHEGEGNPAPMGESAGESRKKKNDKRATSQKTTKKRSNWKRDTKKKKEPGGVRRSVL